LNAKRGKSKPKIFEFDVFGALRTRIYRSSIPDKLEEVIALYYKYFWGTESRK